MRDIELSGTEPVSSIHFFLDLKDNFETICDLLKKHRISSKEIDISQLPPDGSKGQLEEILKILKPKCLHIEGKDLDTEAIEPYFVLEDIVRVFLPLVFYFVEFRKE